MTCVVNLVCPNGHAVAGKPHAYGSDKPPKAWLTTIANDFALLLAGNAAALNMMCTICGARYPGRSPGWLIEIMRMKAETMEEADRQLAGCSDIYHLVDR
jgi:hypothetical protein